MSYSEHVLRIQTETARNLTESLQEWNERLRAFTQRLHIITIKEYSTIDEVNLAIGELELLYSEVGVNDEELEEYDLDTKLLLDTLEENQAGDLRGNYFNTFFKEWDDLKGDVRMQITSVNQTFFANEDELMIKWENKATLTMDLMNIILDVEKFSVEFATSTNSDECQLRFNSLEAKVMANIAIVDTNLSEFIDLQENQLKIAENRSKVKIQEEFMILKKNDLLEKLAEAKKTVTTVIERSREQNQSTANVRGELQKWQKILDENNATLIKLDTNVLTTLSETLEAIDTLEALLAKISTYDADLAVFRASTRTSGIVAVDLVLLIRSFFKNWESCQIKFRERITSFRTHLVQLEKNENTLMMEWRATVTKTITFLDESISESRGYRRLPKQPYSLQDYLVELERVMGKISIQLKLVGDEKVRGHNLITQLQKKNSDLVRIDIESISSKETFLRSNFTTVQSIQRILRDRLTVLSITTRNITEAVAEWQVLLDMYTERLLDIDIAYENEENDIHRTIELLMALFADIKSHDEQLTVFRTDTAYLIETLSAAQVDVVAPVCDTFFENWRFHWSTTSERVTVMETRLIEITRTKIVTEETIAVTEEIAVYSEAPMVGLEDDIELPEPIEVPDSIEISSSVDVNISESVEISSSVDVDISESIQISAAIEVHDNMELIDEWTPIVIELLTWLRDTEIECTSYSGVLPEDHFDIYNFFVRFEALIMKINVKFEYITAKKAQGRDLIEQLVEQANKDKVADDIVMIEEAEMKLRLSLSVVKTSIQEKIRIIIFKRIKAFLEWSPTILKRMNEGDGIGPHFDVVIRQIQEMKLINAQTNQMSFVGLLDPYKSNFILQYLTEEDRIQFKSANEEWISIKLWVDKRLDLLSRAEANWNDYRVRKFDILEYLRDIEQELKAINGIVLNDTEAVKVIIATLVGIKEAMEARKDHVDRLSDSADMLIELLTTANHHTYADDPVYAAIRGEVADILDRWNAMIKASLELKIKVEECFKKFESCYSLYQEVRDWTDACIELLDQFDADKAGEHIVTLKVSIETKQGEIEEYREKLHTVHVWDEQLSREYELSPIYTWPGKGKVKVLNLDYRNTIAKLGGLQEVRGKMKMMSRRLRGSTRSTSSQ